MREVIQKLGSFLSSVVLLLVLQAMAQASASAAITLSPTTVPNWTATKAYSQQVTANGGTGASTFTLSTGTLPTGITLSSTGLLSGTPSAAGSYSFTVKATDTASNIGTQAYTVVIAAAVTVSPSSTSLTGWTVNKAFSQTITSANGTGTRTLSQTGTLPAGITFTAATGVLAGTPTATGASSFTITATDSVGATGQQAYSFTVNAAPAITTTSLAAWTVNKSGYSQTIATSGGTGTPTFAVTTGTLPTGLALSTAGLLSGTPTAAAASTFTITATDTAGATAAQSFTLTVNAAVAITPTTLPAWTANKSGYSQTLSKTGGTGTATFAVTTGTLPAGLTLTTAGALSGTPTTAASSTFTVTATDAVGATATQSYTLVVNAVMAITPTSLAAWTVTKSGYSQTLSKTGGTGTATFAVTTGTLPAGLALSTAGALTGTPTAAGTSAITVTATDTVGATATQSYSLVINAAPSVTTTTLPSWTAGKSGYSQSLASSGGTGTITYAVTTGTLPTGLSLSTAGLLAGTPGAATAGTYPITVTVTDSLAITGNQNLSLVINSAITISPSSLPAWTVNTAGYSKTITAANGTGTLTLTQPTGTLPPGITFTAATGVLAGTPTSAGTYSFGITATDSTGATTSQSYSLVINAALNLGTTTSLAAWTINKSGYSVTLASTGGTGAATYAVTTGSLPTGLSLSTAGAITGTPTTAGTASFTVTATDTVGATGTQTYSIVINPVLAVGPATLPAWTVNKAYSQALSKTGGTGTASYAVTTGTLPAGLALSIAGALTGTPTAAGTSSITITATDSVGATGSTTYSLVINPAVTINDTSLPAWTINKAGYSQTFTRSGGTGTTTSYAVTTGSLPAGLTLTSAGVLSGTPTAAGTFAITITATDSVAATGSASYSLVINPAVTITNTALQAWTINKAGYSQAITNAGGTGTATFAVTAGSLPAGLSLSTAGIVSGTPTAAGTSTFTITATDSLGATGARGLSMVVNPPVSILTSVLPNSTVGKGGYQQVMAAIGGTGTISYAVSGGALPDGLALSTGGVLNGTPTAAGTFNLTLTATDSVGATASRSYTVQIGSPLNFTTTSMPNWTVGKPFSQTISATGGTGAVQFALTTGSVPTGFSLSPAGVLSGTPVAAGTFSFTVAASDNVGSSNTQSYTIVISPAVTISGPVLPPWTVGQAGYTQTVSGANGTGAFTMSISTGAIPPGMAFDPVTGILSGTPTTRGNYPFTVTATDSIGASASSSFSVFINPPVSITTTSLPLWPVGKPGYSQAIGATGGTGALVQTVTSGAVPTGLTLSTSGLLSGTPTVASAFTFTVTATDKVGASASQSYSINITSPAPSITSPQATAITGTSATLSANIVSDGGSTISAWGIVYAPTSSAGNLVTGNPSGITRIPGTGNGTQGVFSFPATGLTPGTAYSFAAYATNSIGTAYSPVGTFTTLSNNTLLSALSLSSGTLSPAFGSSVRSYSATVPNAVTSIAVTASLFDPHATLAVNGGTTVSGQVSDSFPLVAGLNNFLVTVLAQDGITSGTYVVAITRTAAFISLQQPAGVNLANNASTVFFGPASQGQPATLIFTLKNAGSTALSNFAMNLDGPNAADFSVTTPPASPLAANGTTTFVMSFLPLDIGVRNAALHIDATGETGNTFNILLTGNGVAAPAITTPPASQIVALGQPVVLSASATGGSLAYQWLKNGAPLTTSSASGSTFTIPAAALTDAAGYSLKVTNAAGTITSAVASLGVVKSPPASLTLINGTTLTLTTYAAGPGIAYQWTKGGTNLSNGANATSNASTIGGATGSVLTVTKVGSADADSYACVLTLPDPQNAAVPLTFTTTATVVSVTSKPVVDAFTPGPWNVGGAVSDVVTAENNPTAFAVTGQPSGVILDATGHFHGRPAVSITTATTYHLVITASNAAGVCVTPLKVDVVVNPLPASAVGIFNGLVDRDAVLSSGYGGTLNVTSLSSGSFTGKLTLGALSYSFVSQQLTSDQAAPASTVTITRKGLTSLTLSFSIDPVSGQLTGTISDGSAPAVNCLAWRCLWMSSTTNATGTTAQKCPLAATYTSELELDASHISDPAFPQGTGFGTLTVSTSGGTSWSGRMADGAVTTGYATMGPGGQVPLHFMLYGSTGSAHGWAAATADDPTTPANNGLRLLDGAIDWMKNPAATTNTTDRTYRAGILLNTLTVVGGEYVKPATGALVLGLPANTSNASLTFSGANVELSSTYLNASGAGPSDALDGKVFSITSANAVAMPASNPAALVLSLSATTGALGGTFTLKGDADPTSTTGALVTRTATFSGLLVTRLGVNQGLGYFLLAQLPGNGPPKTTSATAPILSGQVVLSAAPAASN